MTNVLGGWGGGGAGGVRAPGSVSHGCASCLSSVGAPSRCSVFLPPFLRICVRRREGTRPQVARKVEEAAGPPHPDPVSTSRCPHTTCLCQPEWGGDPGPPAPGSWVQVGVAATSDPLPQPSWFHTSMNSQVSCSEERDNQPIRGLSPRVVGARVYPNFTRSRGPS